MKVLYRKLGGGSLLFAATCAVFVGWQLHGQGPSSATQNTSTAAVAEANPTKSPQLSRKDFGKLVAGDELSHEFTFQNPFPTQIVFDPKTDVTRDCGCVDFESSATSLAAHQKTVVRMKVSTDNRSGRTARGATIRWKSADATILETRFELTAELEAPIQAEPSEIRWNREATSRQEQRTIRVTSPLQINWSSASAEVSSAAFTVVHQEASDRSLNLTISPQATRREMPPSGSVIIRIPRRTSPEAEPITIAVPIQGEWESDVRVLPTSLPLIPDVAEGRVRARLLVTGATADHEIESVTATVGVLTGRRNRRTRRSNAIS
jgi:hypothetical protein